MILFIKFFVKIFSQICLLFPWILVCISVHFSSMLLYSIYGVQYNPITTHNKSTLISIQLNNHSTFVKVDKIYLSCQGCNDTNILPKTFPYPMNTTTGKKICFISTDNTNTMPSYYKPTPHKYMIGSYSEVYQQNFWKTKQLQRNTFLK